MRVFIIGFVLWFSTLCAEVAAQPMCDDALLSEALPANAQGQGAWRRLFDEDGICIWSRSTYADEVKEVAAAAEIRAAPDALAQLMLDCRQILTVFRDVETCRNLRSAGNRDWMFQQINLPWPAQDRYFAIRLNHRRAGSTLSEVTWTLDDPGTAVPAGRGVALERNTGRWRFRSRQGGGGRTVALYYLQIDPGGSVPLPNWIIDYGHQTAVPGLIRDIRAGLR